MSICILICMPNYTVYIKHSQFKDEQNKSGLLNDLLADYYQDIEVPKKYQSINLESKTAHSDTIQSDTFIPKPPDPETGYPCCEGKRPCKHWQWDANKALYVNSLTGKEREPDE